MKTLPDDPDCNPLLDGVLADEDWRALNATVRTRALGALRARRRQRALLLWGGSAAAAWALAFAALNFIPRQSEPAQPVRVVQATPVHTPYITEEKLLSYFPPGSCTIAEIDGERRLIILDPDIAAHGVAFNGPPP